MVSIEEAQRTILAHITAPETEKTPLFQGVNRVTPEDHATPWDLPAADNSGRLFSLIQGNGLIHLAPETLNACRYAVELLLLDRGFEKRPGCESR